MKITIKDICINAIILALYVIIYFITYPISSGIIQFRFAEILMLLVFFNKKYVVGLTLGCVVCNISSGIPLDWLFGGLCTLVSCLLMGFCKHLVVAAIIPVIINSFGVGGELCVAFQANYWVVTGYVALGEIVVLTAGYIIFMILKHKVKFYELIGANQNIDFRF